MYTYESPEPGDLTFREGDVILVSKKEGEWWNGSIGDHKGLFPSNYVKPKEADVRTIKMRERANQKTAVVTLLFLKVFILMYLCIF